MQCPKCGYVFAPIETGEPCPQCDWVELGIRPREPEWKLRARQPGKPPIDTSKPIYTLMVLVGILIGSAVGLLFKIYLAEHYQWAAELESATAYHRDTYECSILDLIVMFPCFLLGVYLGHLAGGLLAGRRCPPVDEEHEPSDPE